MKSILSVAIATLISFLVCDKLAIASRGTAWTLHCRTIDSASGIYAMKTDPSEVDGSGPARYTLSQDGKELWTREFRFTLFDAWLTDSGTLLGTSYTHGEEGMARDEGSPGFLVVAMIDSHGTVLWTLGDTTYFLEGGYEQDWKFLCWGDSVLSYIGHAKE